MKVLLPIITLILGGMIGYFLRPETPAPLPPEVTLQGLGEVTGGHFTLAEVIQQTSGVKILTADSSHADLLAEIEKAGQKVSHLMSQVGSPARQKRRINEVSSLFEDALREALNSHPNFTCDFPKTRAGETQRAGYPDLRVEHLPSGTIAYLDPKLFEEKSIKSSFRSFYYEPAGETSKVTEDALHLLIGFPHDGKTRQWTFAPPKVVDLSKLTVKLKTEFSASNKELYQK